GCGGGEEGIRGGSPALVLRRWDVSCGGSRPRVGGGSGKGWQASRRPPDGTRTADPDGGAAACRKEVSPLHFFYKNITTLEVRTKCELSANSCELRANFVEQSPEKAHF